METILQQVMSAIPGNAAAGFSSNGASVSD